jgi:hypothetical protein
MLRIPHNGLVASVPMTVTLYDAAGAPWTGQAANLTLSIREINSNYRWDFSVPGFVNTAPVTEWSPAFAPQNGRTHGYAASIPVGSFPRGLFRAIAKHTNGEEWQIDIDHGLTTNFRLGHSATYNLGSPDQLKLTAWVEDEGGRIVDVPANCQLLNTRILVAATGAQHASLGNVSGQTGGLFQYDATVTLAQNTAYILETTARLPGVGAVTYDVKLSAGLIRS